MKELNFGKVIFVILSFISFSVYADTWYVSPTGNDTTGDGSEGNPRRHIQYAVGQANLGDTIKVMDDDDEATDDYVENIDVYKSLTIERYDDTGANPQVKASDADDHVFNVTTDNVTINGLDIYGTTGYANAGIYLNQASNCTIQNNRCGWDSNHKNDYGIYLGSSSDTNTITDNTCSNNYYGIFLSSSSNNTVSANTCNSNNDAGILLSSSSTNTVSGNTCSNNDDGIVGIYLGSSSDTNTITDNTCSNNYYGILLSSSSTNTVSANTCDSNNGDGISLYESSNNTVYLNTFKNNSNDNVYSNDSTNIWHSPTKLGYLYGSSTQTSKSFVGNYYDDYSGSDGDNDGVGETPYDTGEGVGHLDEYPLMQPPDNYSHQTWWLANPMMYRGDMSKAGATITVGGSSSQIWTADQATLMDITFGAGNQAQGTSWTGLITFVSAPVSGDNFTVEIGYADDQDGNGFSAQGPQATLLGDDGTQAFIFATNAVSFTVPNGKYLSLKITNLSISDYDVRVGGSWSGVSAPIDSQDYSLPVELSSFTASVSSNGVTLSWRTESEIDNLGFNVYRALRLAREVKRTADRKDDNFSKINSKLVKGHGTSATPHDYSFTDETAKTGQTYYYYIEDVDFSGEVNKSHILKVTLRQDKRVELLPHETVLMQNYPNPFNPETWIPFQLSESADVVISIYDVGGQLVRKIGFGNMPAGVYVDKAKAAYWDGHNDAGERVTSGLYFYTLQAGYFSATKRMLILK